MKTAYTAFLNVTKASDRAWLDGIIGLITHTDK